METSKIDLSPLTVTVTANPSSIYYGNTTEVSAYVSSEGNPLTGVDVAFRSNSNGTFTAFREDGNGYYRANFTAPANSTLTSIIVTVSAAIFGCLPAEGTARVTLTLPPAVVSQTNTTATRKLVLLIVDGNGDPVSDAQVSTATQPAGMSQLIGTTNQSGYVNFNSTKTGYYAFDITKEGYSPLSQSVSFNGNPVTFMLTQTPTDNTLTIIAPIIAVVLIVVIAVTLIKRRNKHRSTGLQPLNWPMPS